MTKGQIHFGNRLESLIHVLQENLYPEGAGPFEKRIVIVPHLKLKTTLMQALAKDSPTQVAAGLQIVNLNQGVKKVLKKKIPSTLELSLFIQHALPPLIDKEPELARYFAQAKERRLSPFCFRLAQYFLRYALYGKPPLPQWQEDLWQQWHFSLPAAQKTKWQVHLFGFAHLPQSLFSLFAEVDATFYLFSPCSIFWGDFYNKREKAFLRKQVGETQLTFFDESFHGQNELLTRLGKVGRKMHLMLEESGLPSFEHYVEPHKEHALAQLQTQVLMGDEVETIADKSISFFSATSLMHEVEIVRDQIYKLLEKKEPKEIQVFAPDISIYVPYIEALFSSIPHSITDIPRIEEDPICRGFANLLALPSKRFAVEEVCTVLSHFDLDLTLIRRWLTRAHVNWGFSQEQRKQFYLEGASQEEIHAIDGTGTFEEGIKALLIGLGDQTGLQDVGQAEIGECNRFLELLYSLVDDVTPLYDGTKWTIPTWLRYLACLLSSYFAIDPSHDLYKELMEHAAATDHLDEQVFTYPEIKHVPDQLLQKKSKSHQPPHLQAIRFSSLSEGAIESSSALFLLGMEEKVFPRKEENGSLFMGDKAFRPTSSQIDRYLFLQALLSAEDSFCVSYQRSGQLSIITEIKGVEINHPKRKIPLLKELEKPPLIPSFSEKVSLQLLPLVPMEIELRKLIKFAKHPLRYYLNEELGVYPEFRGEDASEFVLDPLSKYLLVREILAGEKPTIPIPSHLTKPLAEEQIAAEIDEWKGAMEAFGIDSTETKAIDLQIGPVHLVGQLEFFSEKGLLVRGKNTLENQIRHLPQALVMQQLGYPLLFTQDHTTFSPSIPFEEYLAYFQLAKQTPSPLLPALAKPLMGKTKWKEIEDETFTYLALCNQPIDPKIIQRNWSPLLRNLLGGVHAEV